MSALVAEVDGWLSTAEGGLLYRLARDCGGAIVEIGSWKGRSTIWIASGSKAGGSATVYAIDPHVGSEEHHRLYGDVDTLDDFRNNIAKAGLSDLVVPIIAASTDAAASVEGEVAMLFVDGAHDYESVRADFEAWAPKLAPGGFVAFHDTAAPGPQRVVKDEIVRRGAFSGIGFVDSIVYAQKRRAHSPLERLRDKSMLRLKSLVDQTRAMHPPLAVRPLGKAILRFLLP